MRCAGEGARLPAEIYPDCVHSRSKQGPWEFLGSELVSAWLGCQAALGFSAGVPKAGDRVARL